MELKFHIFGYDTALLIPINLHLLNHHLNLHRQKPIKMKQTIFAFAVTALIIISGCKPETSNPLATVTTNNVTGITNTSATLGGNVTEAGGSAVTERGFAIGLGTNPIVGANSVVVGSGLGSFSFVDGGLTAGTTYFVRAYAKNSGGIAYGNAVSFTTGGSGSGLVDSNFYFNLNYDGIAHNVKEGLSNEHFSFLDFPSNATDTSVSFAVKDFDHDFAFGLNYEYSRDHAFLNSPGVHIMSTYPFYNSVVAAHLNTGISDDSRELVTRNLDGFGNCIPTTNAYRTITLTITSVTSSDPSKTYVINGSSFDNNTPCYIYEGSMSGELVESHSSGGGCSDDVVHSFSGSFRLVCPKP